MNADYYIPPSCQIRGDAGMGGAIGTGGIPGTGGATGAGGIIGQGGTTTSTGGMSGTGGVTGSGGAVRDAAQDLAFKDANNDLGWPSIMCTSSDATGVAVNIVIIGNIDGYGTDGAYNLIDTQSSSWRNPTPKICVVGNSVGWNNRSYCSPWTSGQTSVVFPPFPVYASGMTEINYVLDNGTGQMIWGNNARLLAASGVSTAVNRCTVVPTYNLVVQPAVFVSATPT